MRRLMKRVAVAILSAACLMSLSACSAAGTEESGGYELSTEGTPVDDAMSQSLTLSAASTLGMSDAQLIVQAELAEAQGSTMDAAVYEKQIEAREEYGDIRSIDIAGATVLQMEDQSYTVLLPVTFAEGEMMYVLNMNMLTNSISVEFQSMSNGDEASSVSDLLKTATVYSGVGMGTVFLVLIFISIIIYCFKFIHEAGNKKNAAPAAKAAPAPAPAAAPAASSEDEDEIAAVIAAAIAAAEADMAATRPAGRPANNGLVVRSIRRIDRAAARM